MEKSRERQEAGRKEAGGGRGRPGAGRGPASGKDAVRQLAIAGMGSTRRLTRPGGTFMWTDVIQVRRPACPLFQRARWMERPWWKTASGHSHPEERGGFFCPAAIHNTPEKGSDWPGLSHVPTLHQSQYLGKVL